MATRIALIGNPNCGKTTMFNALTGANQYVGNWPGVTVEKKEGHYKGNRDVIITDLPGIYSLSPYTLEEVVSRDYLVKEKPEAIIDLVDASTIERNLYLTTQILELGIPVVIALNMMDVVNKRGDKINTKELAKELGCEVVETSALHGTGLTEVVKKAISAANTRAKAVPAKCFSERIEAAITAADSVLPSDAVDNDERRWFDIKMLENDEKVMEKLSLSSVELDKLKAVREGLEKELDNDTESIITDARYDYITNVVKKTVKKSSSGMTTSDKIDRVVTNRWLALPIFAAIMFGVYYFSISTIGTMCTDWVNDTLFGEWIIGGLNSLFESAGVSPVLQSLVVDGIVGGVGTVLGFVPQMAAVFLCLSILEDIGYMARVAFVMDRIFRHFGLSGKSFIPLLVSSGCGVPGILSTKTIENDNDRRLTIMTTTFVPCGAKLPIIALIGTLVVGGAWWMAPVMYFIGIFAVLVSAIILKKTKPFAGEAAPFVMELPAYHVPGAKTILMHVWDRLKGYIKKAGTVIFLACAVMWFMSSFGIEGGAFGLVEDSGNSIMAFVGNIFAWLFIPLGFGNWQPVAASISGLVAKESVVSTVSILAGLSSEIADAAAEEDLTAMQQTALAIAPWFTGGAAAFAFLIFNTLNSPCLAAIGTQAQEMNSKKWFWFTVLFQNINAYCVSLMFYQFGGLITGEIGFSGFTVFAIVVLVIYLYLLFRPNPYKDAKLVTRRSVAQA